MNSKRILVVDDSDFDRDLFTKVLVRHGFEVTQARSSEAALEMIDQNPPDLATLDIIMPGTSGSALVQMIRKKFNRIQLPIVMTTIIDSPDSIVECLNLGANDYIPKPIHFEVAVMRIRTQLQLSELSREMGRLKQVEAIQAMITTCHHELNNPLGAAMCTVQIMDEEGTHDKELISNLKKSLDRMSGVIKRIYALNNQEHLVFENYANSTKMMKID